MEEIYMQAVVEFTTIVCFIIQELQHYISVL